MPTQCNSRPPFSRRNRIPQDRIYQNFPIARVTGWRSRIGGDSLEIGSNCELCECLCEDARPIHKCVDLQPIARRETGVTVLRFRRARLKTLLRSAHCRLMHIAPAFFMIPLCRNYVPATSLLTPELRPASAPPLAKQGEVGRGLLQACTASKAPQTSPSLRGREGAELSQRLLWRRCRLAQ